ncbi:MAG: preprotein translocase subunit YajC [Rickettsiales bacterium]|jgi:preprotein translocase subunit YajC|nr:preprotein translocase subunit YajC [Rickettsiales bacterium]
MAADNTQPAPATTTAGTTQPAVTTPYELSAEKMMMDNLLILGMLFFIFYFILIRPQQRKLKTHQKMLKELAKGNKVLTAGGVIGVINKFEGDDIVHLEVAQGVKLRIARSAITDVVNDATSGASANDN